MELVTFLAQLPSPQSELDLFVRTWGPFLLLLLGAGAMGYLFEKIVIKVIKRATHATETEVDDIIVKAVHPALIFIVFVATVWYGSRWLGHVLPTEVVRWTGQLSFTMMVILGAFVAARLLRGFLRYRASKEPRWKPAASLGNRILSAVLYVVAFLIILGSYGVEITPLLTSLGIAGLAVALALQDTLANFFNGLWIQTGKSLWPGHYVKLEDLNVEGYIVEIGWRTTKIRSLPNNYIVVPNSRVASSVITDYNLPEPMMSAYVEVGVGYECDPVHVEKVLLEIAAEASQDLPGMVSDPPPIVRFTKFDSSSLNFTLIVRVSEFVNQFLTGHELRKRIWHRFKKEGIRIPYPIRDIYMVPPTRADVREDDQPDGASSTSDAPPEQVQETMGEGGETASAA